MPENCFLEHQSKRYTTDLVIPVGREAPGPVIPGLLSDNVIQGGEPVKRSFIPGTEWLFIKIFASWKSIDSILADIIQPFIEEQGAVGRFDKWFFVRYDDPEPNLRLRFYKQNEGPKWSILLLDALNSHIEPLIRNNLVSRVVLDTYERELERYHGCIDLSETLFFYDSVAVAKFLSMIEGEAGEELRWRMGIYSVYRYLTDFRLTSNEKQLFLEAQYATYFKEFNHSLPEGETDLAKSLNEKYRSATKDIEKLLNRTAIDEEMLPLFECFEKRSSDIGALADEIRLRFEGQLGYPANYHSLLASFIHMSVNRLFCSQQRLHELVIYHHLKKYHSSLEKRQKAVRGFTKKASSHEKEDQIY